MRMFLLLLFVVCSLYSSAEDNVLYKRLDRVPRGETILGHGDYGNRTSYQQYYMIFTNKKIYNSRGYFTAIFDAGADDIVDVRFKLVFGNTPMTILVLLSSGRVIELAQTSPPFGPMEENELDPISAGTFDSDEILGDDLYVMTYDAVFVSDSGYNWTIDTIGLDGAYCNDIDIDTLQKVWLCTGNGLFSQELDSTVWKKNANYTGIGCDRVYIDRAQNIWVAYFNTLYVSRDGGGSFQSAPSGLSSGAIKEISDDAFGNIYVMSDSRLYYSQGGTQAFTRVDQPVTGDFALFPSQNVLNGVNGDTLIYLCTNAGLYVSDDQGATWAFDDGVLAEHIGSVSVTADDRLLMTTNNGLFRLESDDTTWAKRYPQTGFVPGSKVYTASNGDIYVFAERVGTNSSGSYLNMVYKSTNNGDTFSPDTTGARAVDLAMYVFFVDENGVQHASAAVNQGGYYKRVWKKSPGQPWELDTVGLPANMDYNINPSCFGTDNNGKVYIAIMNNNTGFTTIYSRPIAGGTWTSETSVNGFVYNVKGRGGIVTAATELGVKYNTGSTWQTAPLPAGVSSTIGWCLSEVASNDVVWAYFETYNTSSIGEGIYYTTDFVNWHQPAGSVDTVLFGELVAIGDSVFALTNGNDGVYVFDTTTAVTGVGVKERMAGNMNVVVIPNPSKGEAVIQFELERQSNVQLTIYNVIGEVVYEMPSRPMNAGKQQLGLHLPASAQGVLLYDLKVNEKAVRGKLVRE